MKKKVVVNSLKSLAIAATFAFGVSAFGSTADAAIIPSKAPVKTVDPEAMDETVINYKKSTLLGIGLSGSLLQPLLGDVQVDVGVQKDVETTEGTLSTGGLVQADITDSGLLGNTHVGVAEKTHIETDDYTYDYSGLAQVDVEGSVVGDAHVGVLENEVVETDEYKHSRDSLALVELENPITGKVSVPVASKEEFENKKPADKEDPGKEDPGKEDPGKEDPGKEDPGKEDPGKEDPKDPGKEDPNQPGDEPGDGNGDDTLPTTGSAMDSTLLVIAALIMMAAGFAVRKLNFRRA